MRDCMAPCSSTRPHPTGPHRSDQRQRPSEREARRGRPTRPHTHLTHDRTVDASTPRSRAGPGPGPGNAQRQRQRSVHRVNCIPALCVWSLCLTPLRRGVSRALTTINSDSSHSPGSYRPAKPPPGPLSNLARPRPGCPRPAVLRVFAQAGAGHAGPHAGRLCIALCEPNRTDCAMLWRPAMAPRCACRTGRSHMRAESPRRAQTEPSHDSARRCCARLCCLVRSPHATSQHLVGCSCRRARRR